jgi:hypothetical protein
VGEPQHRSIPRLFDTCDESMNADRGSESAQVLKRFRTSRHGGIHLNVRAEWSRPYILPCPTAPCKESQPTWGLRRHEGRSRNGPGHEPGSGALQRSAQAGPRQVIRARIRRAACDAGRNPDSADSIEPGGRLSPPRAYAQRART